MMSFYKLLVANMISRKRIQAVILQELYISRHALEIAMDLVFFSVINVVLFGLVSNYLVDSTQSNAGHYIILGAIGWEVIHITQYSMTVSSLWNVWSRNLSNMFITPLSLTEFIVAQMISGVIKSAVIVGMLALVSIPIFHFNWFALGWATVGLSFFNLVLFSWTIGLLLLGLIFRYGVRIQALGWALIYLFQPISAVYFPVTLYPTALQWLAYLFPPTYVFEAMRFSMLYHTVDWHQQLIGFGVNIVYFMVTIVLFRWLFEGARTTGQFARNES